MLVHLVTIVHRLYAAEATAKACRSLMGADLMTVDCIATQQAYSQSTAHNKSLVSGCTRMMASKCQSRLTFDGGHSAHVRGLHATTVSS